jgi:hypothetical protein
MAALTLRQLFQLNDAQIEELLKLAPSDSVTTSQINGPIKQDLLFDEATTKIRFMQDSSDRDHVFQPRNVYRREKSIGNPSLKEGHLFHVHDDPNKQKDGSFSTATDVIGLMQYNDAKTKWLLLTVKTNIRQNTTPFQSDLDYKGIPGYEGTDIYHYRPLFDHIILNQDFPAMGSRQTIRKAIGAVDLLESITVSDVF